MPLNFKNRNTRRREDYTPLQCLKGERIVFLPMGDCSIRHHNHTYVYRIGRYTFTLLGPVTRETLLVRKKVPEKVVSTEETPLQMAPERVK